MMGVNNWNKEKEKGANWEADHTGLKKPDTIPYGR